MTYEERFYRKWSGNTGLVNFNAIHKETDLQISADTDLTSTALNLIKKYRIDIENYIRDFPLFEESLSSITEFKTEGAPEIVRLMLEKSCKASVGPMATVAGALAEFVGKGLLKFSKEVIVENGGDIFISSTSKRVISIYAGKNSLLNNRMGIELGREQMPIGICTSSGKVGHSLSFGNSDAAIVLSKSTILADGVATMLGNKLKDHKDIEKVLDTGMSIEGIEGIILIIGDSIGIRGNIKLVKI